VIFTAYWLFTLITGKSAIDTILPCLPFILPSLLAVWGISVLLKIVRDWTVQAQYNLAAFYFSIYSYAAFVAFMDQVQPGVAVRDSPLLGKDEWLVILALMAVPLLFAMFSILLAPRERVTE